MPRNSLKVAIALSLAVGGIAYAQNNVQPAQPQPVQPGLPAQENQLDRPGEQIFIADRDNDRDEQQKLANIATFVGQDTVAVTRLHLDRIDVQATGEWMKELARSVEVDPQRQQAVLAQLAAQFGVAQWWVDSMKEAGATTIYSVINTREGEQPVSALIVPVDNGDNAQKIRQLLTPKEGAQQQAQMQQMRLETAIIRDTVVLAPQAVINTFQQPQQGDPQAINTALKSVEGSAIQVAFTPTPRMRQWIETLAKQGRDALPQGVQAEQLQQIPQRVEWAAIGIDSPPDQSMKIILNANDEQAAEQVRNTIVQVLNAARENRQVAANVQDIQRIITALTPEVDGEQVVISLDKDDLNQIVRQDLAQAMRRARGDQPVRAVEIPADAERDQNDVQLRDNGQLRNGEQIREEDKNLQDQEIRENGEAQDEFEIMEEDQDLNGIQLQDDRRQDQQIQEPAQEQDELR